MTRIADNEILSDVRRQFNDVALLDGFRPFIGLTVFESQDTFLGDHALSMIGRDSSRLAQKLSWTDFDQRGGFLCTH